MHSMDRSAFAPRLSLQDQRAVCKSFSFPRKCPVPLLSLWEGADKPPGNELEFGLARKAKAKAFAAFVIHRALCPERSRPDAAVGRPDEAWKRPARGREAFEAESGFAHDLPPVLGPRGDQPGLENPLQ